MSRKQGLGLASHRRAVGFKEVADRVTRVGSGRQHHTDDEHKDKPTTSRK
jgi:hypothetical protein